MATEKTERLLNLLIMLLVQRRHISKEQIRGFLYPDAGPDAFEKMFERDKEELRSLGVPIEVGAMDTYFDDEPGYRIKPDAFALPDIDLLPDEANVIGLASKVWQHATLARATTDAVRKLTAAGLDVDVSALDIAQPRLTADEPSFDVFWDAVQTKTLVEFDYQRSSETSSSRRHLQTWGVTRFSGRWYAVGFDTDRQNERIFRLSRVRGNAKLKGKPGSYEIPSDVDLRGITARLTQEPPPEPGTILVRAGAALPLRRSAIAVEVGVLGPDERTTWDQITLTHTGVSAAEDLMSFGSDVYVDQPGPLRDTLIARLTEAVK